MPVFASLSLSPSALRQVSPTPAAGCSESSTWECAKKKFDHLTGSDVTCPTAAGSLRNEASLERRWKLSCRAVHGHSIRRGIPFSNSSLQARVLASPCELTSAMECRTSSSNGCWSLLLHSFQPLAVLILPLVPVQRREGFFLQYIVTAEGDE